MRNVCLGLLAIIVILLVIRSPSQDTSSDMNNQYLIRVHERTNELQNAW